MKPKTSFRSTVLQLERMAGWKLKDELLSPETDMETCVDSQPVYVWRCYSTERVLLYSGLCRDALANYNAVFF